jgi:uncharacterized protein YndB with AHSA1/START domain
MGEGGKARGKVTKLEKDIHIEASPDAVYDVVTDPDCLGDWVTIQDRLEEAPNGDLVRGSRLVQRLRVAGKCFNVAWTVKEADRPTKIVWEGKGPLGTKAKAVYELEANDGGCRFSYMNEYKLPGGVAGAAVGQALRRVSGHEADRSLKRLKALIERK